MSEEQNKNRERREFERGNNFDVFVSYRRSDGKSFAKTLNLAFKNEGFRCFLDYSDLEGGDFRKQLQDAVVDAPIFVMVMTPDYFARCVKKVETADGKTVFEPNEDDWVRREIDLALKNGKIIIPINMNGILKGTPDYLDEDFGNRVGCHQFSSVYDDDTFDSSFAGMLAKNIWNRFSKLEKPTDKAMVTVATDADCKLMKNNQLLATLQADEHSPILLGKGNHLLQARSEEFPQISVNVIKKIEDVSCDDFIIIELKDKLPKKPSEPVEPPQPEPPQPNVVTPTPTNVPQVPNDFRELRTLTGHSEKIYSVAVSPDGKYLASGSDNKPYYGDGGELFLWHPNTGELILNLKGHSNNVQSVCWSPDGKYLASGLAIMTAEKNLWNGNKYLGKIDPVYTGEINLWDVSREKCIQTLKGHSDFVESVCWSPDGRYLASGSDDKTVIIWDANSGQRLKSLEGHYGNVESVCWSPDGKYLASGSRDNTVKIWNINCGVCILTLKGHSDVVLSVCWSPDGKYLASGSTDKTVIIWDAKSGQRLKSLEGHSGSVGSVCWSPDGNYLASGSGDKTVVIWDANSGERLKTLEGHSDVVESVCWSPDGKYLVSGSWDKTIKIWGVE